MTDADRERVAVLADRLDVLHGEATPGEWRCDGGGTHLEVRAPHQRQRSVARVYCDLDAAHVVAAHNLWPEVAATLRRLLAELDAVTAERDADRAAVRDFLRFLRAVPDGATARMIADTAWRRMGGTS